MRRIALVLTLFAATASYAAPPAADATRIPSPTEKPLAVLDALRANDAEAFAEAVSRKSSSELALEWERERAKAASNEKSHTRGEDAHRIWNQLRTAEGTAALVDELQPKIAEQASTAVLQFNLGLAAAMTAVVTEAKLPAAEAQQVSQVLLAVQRWANGIDFTDRARLERAVGAVAGFVRQSGLETPRELELLAYEEALALGDDAIAMVKRIAAAYDLDVDALLASIRVEELARDGERATMRVSANVLGVPIAVTREMEYRHGHWRDVDDAPRAQPAVLESTEAR